MGYRSTLISDHYGGELPSWFKDKWKNYLSFNSTLIASTQEFKIYDNEVFEDYQRALAEVGILKAEGDFCVNVLVLGESGAVSKVEIFKDMIRIYSMKDTFEMDFVHSY